MMILTLSKVHICSLCLLCVGVFHFVLYDGYLLSSTWALESAIIDQFMFQIS